MKLPPSLSRRIDAWFTPEEQKVFKVQIIVIFVVITLLNLGFNYERELLAIDAKRNVQRIMRFWDGAAWYIWIVAAPITLLLIRLFPLRREAFWTNLLRLLAGSVVVFIGITNVRFLIRIAPNLWQKPDPALPIDWTSYWHTQSLLLPIDFLSYCGFFAASLATDYYFKFRRRTEDIMQLQLQASQLQAELTRSQLTALRGQLHPHFLFNAFNAISSLVRQGKNEPAVNMITQLSAMLRMSMQNIDHQEVSLDQELDFVNSYLNVEKVRFSDKLRTEFAVDPATRRCIVPNLLLQPLVENAIKHGISRRISQGTVKVSAERNEDRIIMQVIDDGAEEDGSLLPHEKSGIGLTNTHSRLRHIYRNNYRLDIITRPEGGTIVRIDLPWREGQPRTVASVEAQAALA